MPRSLESSSEFTVDRRKSADRGDAALSIERQSLIDELESAIIHRNIGSRADVLRRVTDIFVTGSDRFDGDQLALFDDIMGRLVNEIENTARVAFGERLATIANAPPRVSCTLALDDSIEVARPLLIHSEQLDEKTLVTGAKTKSQQHLLAISQRKNLSENVTDVLVERGDQQVAVSTAANSGAQFSNFGYSRLISRSETDGELALTVWSRSEISHEYLLTLFETASEAVRLKLESADRGKAALIRNMVKRASEKMQVLARESSPNFLAAQATVQSLHEAGALNEDRLREFAQAGKFDETAVAIALLSDLPIGAIERTLVLDHSNHMLILAKSIGLSWETTKAILRFRSNGKTKWVSTYDMEQLFSNFKKLRPETARTAIQFYRLQERAAKTSSNR
jgi:uncharacterized protein (DUF2336 family)